MPWSVRKSDSCPASKPFGVIKDSDGSVAGCHPSRESANEQMAALYANESGMSVEEWETAMRWLGRLLES